MTAAKQPACYVAAKPQLDDCRRRRHKLNSWEEKFLADLETKLKNGVVPSPRQTEKLDEIWEKATKNG